jgi:alkylation response protein AidB-like acyl-CoA dehydrogenase
MTLTFTDEQEELRHSVRRFLADKAPMASVRTAVETEEGHDRGVWAQMAGQLGLQGIALPEEFGGLGFGAVELGIVLEELGRALSPEPFLATVALAGRALAAAGDDEARRRWLPGIVDGSVTAALAVTEDGGGWSIGALRTVANLPPSATGGSAHSPGRFGRVAALAAGGGVTLTGVKTFVIDGEGADLLVVAARTPEGAAELYAVDATEGPAGLTRTRQEVLDSTRRLARVDLVDVPARPLGLTEIQVSVLLDLAVIAVSAEQVGTAKACLDLSVEYAKTRVQFGRPIGSFQAIKHKCANMLLALESARSALYHAASLAAAPEPDPAELSAAAAVCGAWCAQTAVDAAKETIQIHGGIGFTWEHDSHLYLKRAKSSELLFGVPTTHRARLADLVGI